MGKSKPQSFESIRREIARRLQTGLPLAGMIAATTLLCGCEEKSSRGVLAGMPVPPKNHSEQKSEQPKPKASNPPNKNDKSETENDLPAGAIKPPPNGKNESVDPASTMGRYPAKPEKEKK